MPGQKQEQAEAATNPSPGLFAIHPTLFFLFSSLDSNFQFPPTAAKRPRMDEGEEGQQKLSAMGHVKKRHEEKGLLYACFFMLCCCFCCYEACEHCLECFCCCGNKDE
ncbi:uncharacterized protein LOC100828400 [Brachypodium distachyon]|uniref:Cysteine-rich transmembrane CYSTM domain-containing protein n=1 Tax=Brachypodium distachyon TaxID=15368 RepID=I1HYM6_BRADI|nr:uncharacterized protein LOC100828400 [Brachypodium distachyon]KQJ93978.1 hypothetical protein BRADI_3g07860v3 [Brachypodium distachyon]|eukprot:XP_003571585.1 uncharacterized protein LOC100828400 [Brachypodium distachyon]